MEHLFYVIIILKNVSVMLYVGFIFKYYGISKYWEINFEKFINIILSKVFLKQTYHKSLRQECQFCILIEFWLGIVHWVFVFLCRNWFNIDDRSPSILNS